MPTQSKPKKIQIPIELFHKIIAFMECCDISGCDDPELKKLYRDIVSGLVEKQGNIELRESYAKVVYANGDRQKKDALAAYIEQKELNQL